MAHLAVGGKTAVNKEIKAGGNALKIDIILLVRLFIELYGAPVVTRGVILRHMGRVERERIKKIAVKRHIEAFAKLRLPAFRHFELHICPSRSQIGGDIFKSLIELKIPVAAKVYEMLGAVSVAAESCLFAVIRYKICPRLLAADMQMLKALVVRFEFHNLPLSLHIKFISYIAFICKAVVKDFKHEGKFFTAHARVIYQRHVLGLARPSIILRQKRYPDSPCGAFLG